MRAFLKFQLSWFRLCGGIVGVASAVAFGSRGSLSSATPSHSIWAVVGSPVQVLSSSRAFVLLYPTPPTSSRVFDAEGVVGARLDLTTICDPFPCIHPKLMHAQIWAFSVPVRVMVGFHFFVVVRLCGTTFVEDVL